MHSAYKEYSDKGLTGLANVGNTCYVNSCMQILSHTYELNDFLNKGSYTKRLKRKPESLLLHEWDKLRKLMWSKNCTIAPYGFIKAMQKVAVLKNRELFSGYAQNDIHEYLLFIVDCFHEALSRPVTMTISGVASTETDKLAKSCYNMMKEMYNKEYSEILNIYFGIHVSVVTSKETGDKLSICPEPFSCLSLSIPGDIRNPTIFDCLDLYCKKEELSGKNQYETNDGARVDAEKGIVFWSLPNVLIVDLKRWMPVNGRKNNILVRTPYDNIDLSKYVKGYDANNSVYELFGVCNHSGGALGGHYVACVKNANRKWYEFNDTMVREIRQEHVISSNSYCLFYRKKK